MPSFPYQPVANVAQINAYFTQDQQQVQNVFYWFPAATLTPALLLALGNAYVQWERDFGMHARSGTVRLVEVKVVDLTIQNGNEAIVPIADVVAGLDPQLPMPNNVTIAVKHLSPGRGRGRSGRTFWVGLTARQVAGNQITTTAAADLPALYGNLVTALNTAVPGSMVVVHRVLNHVRPAAASVSVVTGFGFSDLVLDSQRRRLPAHGRHRHHA